MQPMPSLMTIPEGSGRRSLGLRQTASRTAVESATSAPPPPPARNESSLLQPKLFEDHNDFPADAATHSNRMYVRKKLTEAVAAVSKVETLLKPSASRDGAVEIRLSLELCARVLGDMLPVLKLEGRTGEQFANRLLEAIQDLGTPPVQGGQQHIPLDPRPVAGVLVELLSIQRDLGILSHDDWQKNILDLGQKSADQATDLHQLLHSGRYAKWRRRAEKATTTTLLAFEASRLAAVLEGLSKSTEIEQVLQPFRGGFPEATRSLQSLASLAARGQLADPSPKLKAATTAFDRFSERFSVLEADREAKRLAAEAEAAAQARRALDAELEKKGIKHQMALTEYKLFLTATVKCSTSGAVLAAAKPFLAEMSLSREQMVHWLLSYKGASHGARTVAREWAPFLREGGKDVVFTDAEFKFLCDMAPEEAGNKGFLDGLYSRWTAGEKERAFFIAAELGSFTFEQIDYFARHYAFDPSFQARFSQRYGASQSARNNAPRD